MKKRITRMWRYPLLVLVVLVLSACQQAASVEHIQGLWSYEDLHLKPISGEMQYIENWLIDNGSFAVQGCCFSETNLTGSYRILEADEDAVVLELYDMRGNQGPQAVSPETVSQITIRINSDGTIDIGRNRGYIRISEAIGD